MIPTYLILIFFAYELCNHSAFTDFKAKRLPIDQYQSICGIVTDGFQEVSQQIQAIERQLRDTYSREDLAQLIRRVQESEREKLKLVRCDPLAFSVKISGNM